MTSARGVFDQFYRESTKADLPEPNQPPAIGLTHEGWFEWPKGGDSWQRIPIGTASNPVGSVTMESIRTDELSTKEKPVYDVTQWGTVGDGSTNDAPAVQAAGDAAASAGGGTVFFPAGTFEMGETVDVANWNGVTVTGAGMGATTVTAGGDDYSAFEGISSSSDYLEDFTIRDMTIDCSQLGDGATYSTDEKCIFTQYTRRMQILNVFAYGAPATGIGTDFMEESLIHGCIAENNGRLYPGTIGGNGIGVGTGRSNHETVIVSDCHTVDNGNNGIMFEGQGPDTDDVASHYMRVAGCTAVDNRQGFRDTGNQRVHFSACDAAENTLDGFVVDTKDDTSVRPQYYTFTNCRSWDNCQHGFHVAGGETDLFATFDNVVAVSNDSNGLRVGTGASCGNWDVQGSWFYNNGWSGIHALDGGSNVLINGTTVINNGTGTNTSDDDGIKFSANSNGYSNVCVTNCRVTDEGGNQQYGIVYSGTTASGFVIEGNNVTGNADINIGWTTGVPIVRNNEGFGAMSSPPTEPNTGSVYLDDGTNTGDSTPAYRYYDGTVWHDL